MRYKNVVTYARSREEHARRAIILLFYYYDDRFLTFNNGFFFFYSLTIGSVIRKTVDRVPCTEISSRDTTSGQWKRIWFGNFILAGGGVVIFFFFFFFIVTEQGSKENNDGVYPTKNPLLPQ